MTGLVGLASATLMFASLNGVAPVSVEGAVKMNGPVVIKEATSVRTVVKQAGGFAANADLRAIELRSNNGQCRTVNLFSLEANASVFPGETLRVPVLDPKSVVFVEGPIANRAPIDFRPGLNLAEVLATAHPTNIKEMDRVIVKRADANGKVIKTVYKATELPKNASAVVLQPGDTVSVPYASSVQTSDRELLTIVVIALLVIIIVK